MLADSGILIEMPDGTVLDRGKLWDAQLRLLAAYEGEPIEQGLNVEPEPDGSVTVIAFLARDGRPFRLGTIRRDELLP